MLNKERRGVNIFVKIWKFEIRNFVNERSGILLLLLLLVDNIMCIIWVVTSSQTKFLSWWSVQLIAASRHVHPNLQTTEGEIIIINFFGFARKIFGHLPTPEYPPLS